MGLKVREVAANLGVDVATVSRVVTRFRQSGSVQRNIRLHSNNCKITETIQPLHCLATSRNIPA